MMIETVLQKTAGWQLTYSYIDDHSQTGQYYYFIARDEKDAIAVILNFVGGEILE